jgi:hypothetical protein
MATTINLFTPFFFILAVLVLGVLINDINEQTTKKEQPYVEFCFERGLDFQSRYYDYVECYNTTNGVISKFSALIVEKGEQDELD